MARNKNRRNQDYYRTYFEKRQIVVNLVRQLVAVYGALPEHLQYLEYLAAEPDWQDNKEVQKTLRKAVKKWRML